MRSLAAITAFVLLSTFASAQEASVEGTWRDEYGTAFAISLCGDGHQLCAVLLDVQGKSRTEENLAYVGKQVIQAAETAPNRWEGTVIFNGSEAKGIVTQVSDNTIEIEGCRGILCNTLAFNRVE